MSVAFLYDSCYNNLVLQDLTARVRFFLNIIGGSPSQENNDDS